MKVMDTAANSKAKAGDIVVCSDIVCLPDEQIAKKGIRYTNKVSLGDMFSQLVSAVRRKTYKKDYAYEKPLH